MALDIDVRADIKATQKSLQIFSDKVIRPATVSALNKTAGNVKVAVSKVMVKRTGLKSTEVKNHIDIHKARPWILSADVIGRRRSFNLRRFVSPSKLKIGAFDKQLGVISSPWRRRRIFKGAFIISGKTHGKLIVVARTSANRFPLKGLYGPSLHIEFNRPSVKRFMAITAQRRFIVNFERDLNHFNLRATQ